MKTVGEVMTRGLLELAQDTLLADAAAASVAAASTCRRSPVMIVSTVAMFDS